MDDKDEIFKLVCFISDGTISAQDGCHQIKHLIDKKCNEARIDENQRWANGYGQVLLDHPAIDDSHAFMAAKQDFEDRIAELTKGGNNE